MFNPGFIFFVILLCLIIDGYTYQAIKSVFEYKATPYVALTLSILWSIFVVYGLFIGDGKYWRSIILTGLCLLYIPKLIIIVVLLLEDISRITQYGYNYLFEEKLMMPSRRKFVGQLAIGLSFIPFLGVLYGVTKGRFRYTLIKKTLFFKDLPANFDGFTIIQLSDVHAGSFPKTSIDEVKKGIALVNAQHPDLVVFTGDWVNNQAEELNPWIEVFRAIEAPFGKISVLGNHDYGMYHTFSEDPVENAKRRVENVEMLCQMNKAMQFDMLRNTHKTIHKEDQQINVIGVENWSSSPYFPKKGNLKQAMEEIPSGAFNVLLSHDPSHFDYDSVEYNATDEQREEKPVKDFEKKIQLTFSGHTHGAQMGINIPGFKWSPSQYIYKKWWGLYQENNRYLYVNRGFGYLGFPGRIGMWPEITCIELKVQKE